MLIIFRLINKGSRITLLSLCLLFLLFAASSSLFCFSCFSLSLSSSSICFFNLASSLHLSFRYCKAWSAVGRLFGSLCIIFSTNDFCRELNELKSGCFCKILLYITSFVILVLSPHGDIPLTAKFKTAPALKKSDE